MSTSPEPGTPAPEPAANPVPPAPSPPWTLEQLVPAAIGMVAGFAWGAIMLIVLGFWLRTKNEAGTRGLANVFFVAGGISAGLAFWQAFTLWFQKSSPQEKTTALAQQRRILGYVLLLGGLALIILAFILGVGKKGGSDLRFLEANLGESIGAVLLGVIALASGYLLTLPPQPDSQASMRTLLGMTPAIKLVLLIVAAVALVAFGTIAYQHRTAYRDWVPELAALLFLSVLALSCVIWLNTGKFDETGMRLLVLVFGGSLGLILFLYAVARAYLWRQDVILGGIAAWQGPNGWRVWLVAYVQIVALILMFASFSVARADIRTSAALRRVMYGYDAILQGLLLIELLAVGNVVFAYLYPFTYDWTKTRGAYALSDSSINLIRGLKKDINLVVLMRPGNAIYRDLHNLLDNCEAINSTKFHVTYISPEAEPVRLESLLKAFPSMVPEFGGLSPGVLVIDGPIPATKEGAPPFVFIAERKLAEGGRGMGEKSKRVFKGETEILKEVKFMVTGKEKRKIYVLQGDGEADINNKEFHDRGGEFQEGFSQVGLGVLVDRLTADGYEITGLNFHKEFGKPPANVVYVKAEGNKKDVPGDCQTLIIPGASRKMPEDALEAIERYLDRGGKLISFFDVVVEEDYSKMVDTGLESLLRKGYGVDVTNEFPLRVPLSERDDVRVLFAFSPRGSSNPLAREFSRPIWMKRSARIIKEAEGPGRRSFKADTVLQATFDPDRGTFYTAESKAAILKNPQAYMIGRMPKIEAVIQEKPLPVAVAVSEGEKPRMVIFGDTEFITNAELARSPTSATSYSFIVSSIEWLAGREELIGALPKESTSYVLGPEVNYSRMVFLPGWIMLIMIIGLGVAVWIVRRR